MTTSEPTTEIVEEITSQSTTHDIIVVLKMIVQYLESFTMDKASRDVMSAAADRLESQEQTIAALTARAEQERQWISVQDRLPDMCGCKCLVAAVNKFGQTEVFTAFIGHMERGKLEFHSCEPTHEIPAWTVTHWMPLPEPPKDELKGE